MTAKQYPSTVTKKYLRANPDHVFVFGDNTKRYGKKGASMLRDEPNTYGFITKKFPSNNDYSFYTKEDYPTVYDREIAYLKEAIESNPSKTYLISRLGGGLANRHGIHDLIRSRITTDLKDYDNVVFLDNWNSPDIMRLPLFDYERANLLHAEGEEYRITGTNIMVEHGLYENPPDSILPYTVLEEAFENHAIIKREPMFFSNKELGMDHIKERHSVLLNRQKTGIIT